MKLKYWLPLAQMVLAVVLLWCSYLGMRAEMRVQDMPGPAPAFTLLMSINLPVALVHGYVYWHFSALWELGLTAATIGALWYWISLNIDSWRERKMILQFESAPLRIGADLLAIPLGLLLEVICIRETYLPLPWRIPTYASLFIWSLGPMFLFGRDLVYCVRCKSPKIGD